MAAAVSVSARRATGSRAVAKIALTLLRYTQLCKARSSGCESGRVGARRPLLRRRPRKETAKAVRSLHLLLRNRYRKDARTVCVAAPVHLRKRRSRYCAASIYQPLAQQSVGGP